MIFSKRLGKDFLGHPVKTLLSAYMCIRGIKPTKSGNKAYVMSITLFTPRDKCKIKLSMHFDIV